MNCGKGKLILISVETQRCLAKQIVRKNMRYVYDFIVIVR